MKYLVTGAAGFIGMHTCLKLLKTNSTIIGIDNLNSYYNVKLKRDRLKNLKKNKNFKFFKVDIANYKKIYKIFRLFKPDYVINLAAQAGVRYSIKNPFEYSRSNLVGFCHILECCKLFRVKHLIFASSSSVYGGNKNYPFKESHNVDYPISFYAASKKCNEVMGHSYSYLFKIPMTGLRFFTVYGPWGRPDMFLALLTNAIKKRKYISIFNKGDMYRDFTYIDDVVEAIIKISKKTPQIQKRELAKFKSDAPFKIFNVGNSKPVYLKKVISLVENNLKKKAKKKYLKMQQGDVKFTHANINSISKWIKFKPKTTIQQGIKKFINWHNSYYNSY